MTELHISLADEGIFQLGSVAVTNGMLAAFAVTAMLAAMAFFGGRTMGVVPSRLQVLLEVPFGFVRDQLTAAFGSRKEADKFMPLMLTLMLFIGVSNQFSLVPLVSAVTWGETPLLRVPTSVLGQTLAMSLVVVGLAHVLALRISPLRHIGNFIKIESVLAIRKPADIGKAFLDVFLGLMDIVSEFAKVVSLAARLFGNVFAGEVMVAVIASLTAYTKFFVPIPFYVLSIFSGLVQTLVFTLLSIQFVSATVSSVRQKEAA